MAHEIYALVYEGVVSNIIVGNHSDCNDVAKATINEAAFAVDVTNIPVQIGDQFKDGRFTRGDEKIDPLPTEEQQVSKLIAQNIEMRAELDAVSMAVLDLAKGVLNG